MNKILNINLGGFALTIDDDAYEYLSAYLDSIRRRFSESEGRDEIMTDIESRLGEIISTGMGNRTIVMLPDVEAAIEVMGKPEDFGGEPVENPGAGKSAKRVIQPAKKLFRDEDDAVIGGVCSGLAAYFGFQETVWMRVIFVLLALASFGFWVPAYLLLWILVPPARTAAERLAMRGETPNVENIAREIEHGVERISKRVNEFGAKAGTSAGRGSAAVASGCLTVVGKLFLGFVIFVAVAMIFGLGTAWVAGIWAVMTAQPYISYFSPLSGSATSLGFFNGFFLLGIPIVGLVLWLGRTIFRFNTPAWLGSGMTILWVLNLVSLVLLGGFAFSGYRQSGSVSKKVDLSGITSDTLQIQWAGRGATNENDHNSFFDGEDIWVGDDRLDMDALVRITIRRSDTGRFEFAQTIRARGSSTEEAVEYAAKTNFEVKSNGNVLLVPSGYTLDKGNKWRGQEVRITISVPEGKYIVFGDVINRRIYDADYADSDREYSIQRNPGKAFRMTGTGLICSDCPQFGDSNYRSDRTYENFTLEGNFETEIIQADEFSMEFDGSPEDRNAIETIRSGDNLTLTTRGKKLVGKTRCIIRTPVFTNLIADHTDPVTIRGFNEGRASITAKGPVRIRGFFDSNELNLALSGKCFVELTGNGNDLHATLTDGAELEATSWRTDKAEISANDSARARLNVNDHAMVNADASSSVKVAGSATIEQQ
jgi:phage shock protein PspC (stress-responsive transcriptional regulator)